jgi:hypothetical protein
MKRTLLKALVMLEKWENSWFLNGGFHESIDGQLIDVKALRVNMRDFDGTLRMVVKQAPDVLLLESTLTPHFVSRMAIQVRSKLPNLPILLLPDIHGAVSSWTVAPRPATTRLRPTPLREPCVTPMVILGCSARCCKWR